MTDHNTTKHILGDSLTRKVTMLYVEHGEIKSFDPAQNPTGAYDLHAKMARLEKKGDDGCKDAGLYVEYIAEEKHLNLDDIAHRLEVNLLSADGEPETPFSLLSAGEKSNPITVAGTLAENNKKLAEFKNSSQQVLDLRGAAKAIQQEIAPSYKTIIRKLQEYIDKPAQKKDSLSARISHWFKRPSSSTPAPATKPVTNPKPQQPPKHP